MPTYRNDGPGYEAVELTDGRDYLVAPGETVQTYRRYPGKSNLTMTSEEPRYNPVIGVDNVVDTGSAVSVDADAESLEIYNKSSSDVDMYWDNGQNTPATPVPAGGYRKFTDIKGLCDTLVFSFSGSISAGELKVVQWSRKI